MSIEAMKQALEALENKRHEYRAYQAITALRQAIEQAEKQQAPDKKADNARELGLDYEPFPVAWVCEGFGKEKHNLDYVQEDIDALEIGTALYTAPPQTENQEPDLPPVGIGVDVTAQGATVVGFYRRPNAVSEMFYSEFHPSPPRKEWVGLTDEERVQAFADAGLELAYMDYDADMKISKVIEAKLREKNT